MVEIRLHIGTMSQWWLDQGLFNDEHMCAMASILERDCPVFRYRGVQYQVCSVEVEGNAFVAVCRRVDGAERTVEAEVAVTA